MSPAEWRAFKEGIFARIYSGGPDAIKLLKQRTSRITSQAQTWYNISLTFDETEKQVTPSERHEMTKPKLSRAEVIQQQLKALQAEAAHLARFPEDNFPEHTVLMTWKTYTKEVPTQGAPLANPGVYQWVTEKRDFTYPYVLLKANDQWWMTGQNGHQINGASWDKVIDFVDKDDMIDVRTGKSIMLDSDDANPKLNDRDALADVVDEATLAAQAKSKPIYDDRA
jgi:hypothetical protein